MTQVCEALATRKQWQGTQYQLDGLEQKVNQNLQPKVEKANVALVNIAIQIAAWIAIITGIQGTINGLLGKKSVEQLEKEIDSRLRDLDQLQYDNERRDEALSARVDKLNAAVAATNIRVTATEVAIANNNSAIANNNAAIARNERSNADNKAAIAASDRRIEANGNAIRAVEAVAAEALATARVAAEDARRARQQYFDLVDQVNSLKAFVEELLGSSASNGDLGSLPEQVRDLAQAFRYLELQTASLEADARLTKVLAARAAAEAGEAATVTRTVKKGVTTLGNELGGLRTTTRTGFAEVTTKFEDVNKQVQRLRAVGGGGISLGRVKAEIESATEPFYTRADSLEADNNRLFARSAKYEADLAKEVRERQARYAELKAQANSNSQGINSLTDSISDIELAIGDYANEEDSIATRLTAIEAGGAGTFDPTAINDRLATVEADLSLTQEQYDDLSVGIGDIDAKLAAFPAALGIALFSKLNPSLNQLISQTAPGAVAQSLEKEFSAIKNRVSPASLTSAAANGVCSTTAPGGCLGTGGNWQKNLLDGFGKNLGNIIGAGNTALSGLILAVTKNTNGIVRTMKPVLDKVNATSSLISNNLNKLSELSQKAWKAAQLDKILAVLTFITTTHNAMMLSRNLASTMGEATNSVLRFLKVKNPLNGEDLDVNQILGNSFNSYINQVFGSANVAATKKTFKAANRILTAANGAIMAIRQTKDAAVEVGEVLGDWIAKIVNGMITQGMFEDGIFPWMKEKPGFRDHYSGYRNKVENIEEAVGSVSQLAESGVEFQEATNETLKSFTELTKALDDFDVAKAVEEDAKDADSASPAITNADLNKNETTTP